MSKYVIAARDLILYVLWFQLRGVLASWLCVLVILDSLGPPLLYLIGQWIPIKGFHIPRFIYCPAVRSGR